EGGTINIGLDTLDPIQPLIKLSPGEMKLSVAESSITLTPASIVIRFAEFSITLDAAGIAMSVAANGIRITEALVNGYVDAWGWCIENAGVTLVGPSIEMLFESEYSLECASLTETVAGDTLRNAGVAMA